MCGVLGVIGARPGRDWEAVGNLTAHRGPDAFGLWYDDHALLGHNRLAIIDLSIAANQPMHSDDERYVIVFNGEIFNFRDLRNQLTHEGANFKTRSDTEVLLAAYRKWGRAMLDRLDGMFAFAIWDRAQRHLFAARDHIGIKPFYYHHAPGQLVFGSELKTLTATVDRPLKLRVASIYEYLVYSYIPAPFTPYEGYLKLEPGHCLEYDERSDHLSVMRWWEVPISTSGERSTRSYASAVVELRETLHAAVERRIISDVPLGAFLSGGIDSSIIVAEMASLGNTVTSFSIGYKDNADYDETYYAELLADRIGVRHTVLYPEFDELNIGKYADLIVRQFDEPYGNPTVILTYLLTEMARHRVTVALVGDGSDELFGGYPRHRALLLAAKTASWARPISPLIELFLRMSRETPAADHRIRRARRFLRALKKPAGQAFQDWTSVFDTETLLSSMVHAPGKVPQGARLRLIRERFERSGQDPVANAGYADLNGFLPYNLLEGADRLSMANGFELRVPYVAKSMIEFAATLPSEWKIRGSEQKAILKDAYRDVLPPEILSRRKRGFNPPVWHWLQSSRGYVEEKLGSSARSYRFIDYRYVQGLIEKFYSRRADCSSELWSLLILEHWLCSVPSSAIQGASSYA